MEVQMIFNIIIIILIIAAIAIQFMGRKESDLGRIETMVKQNAKEQRDEVQNQLSHGTTEQFKRFDEIGLSVHNALQAGRMETNDYLGKFSELTQKSLQRNREEGSKQFREFQDHMVSTLGHRMKSLQDNNDKRLEQMQGVVDEKLQKTLETRLSQSFNLVSHQLDSVQQGLGEMKNLAADTKSLRNALTNVKERGTYGEVRLEKLLADILAPSQYVSNVEIADNRRIEFGIKLPGNGDEPLLLPIDSKFPIEDYNRLIDAEDRETTEDARRSLATRIRVFAKNIHDKYIVPPKTTDFALMFLPTEGLYAEVVRNVPLFEELRDKYQVTVVGITTLSAYLSSLQMGFKTLAIEQRSQEVWDTLRAVKSEFGKFEGMLEKAHKQLQTADRTLDTIVGTRTRAINRALREVEEMKLEELKKIEGDQLGIGSITNEMQPSEEELSTTEEFQLLDEVQIPESSHPLLEEWSLPDVVQPDSIQLPEELPLPAMAQKPERLQLTDELEIPSIAQITEEMQLPESPQLPEEPPIIEVLSEIPQLPEEPPIIEVFPESPQLSEEPPIIEVLPESPQLPEEPPIIEVFPENTQLPEEAPIIEVFPESPQLPEELLPLDTVQLPESPQLPEELPPLDAIQLPESPQLSEELPPLDAVQLPESPQLPEELPPLDAVQLPESPQLPEELPLLDAIQLPESPQLPEELPSLDAVQLPESPQLPEELPIPDMVQIPERERLTDDVQIPDRAQLPDALQKSDVSGMPDLDRLSEDLPIPQRDQLPDSLEMPDLDQLTEDLQIPSTIGKPDTDSKELGKEQLLSFSDIEGALRRQ